MSPLQRPNLVLPWGLLDGLHLYRNFSIKWRSQILQWCLQQMLLTVWQYNQSHLISKCWVARFLREGKSGGPFSPAAGKFIMPLHLLFQEPLEKWTMLSPPSSPQFILSIYLCGKLSSFNFVQQPHHCPHTFNLAYTFLSVLHKRDQLFQDFW